ncbi:DMT family transporter [Litorivicinus sp.]|nr:DMT family transporter [Litorivicinus sp.]
MLGALLSFLSAAFFGFNAVMMRRGVLTGSALQGLSFTLPLGALFFGLASLVLLDVSDIETLNWTATWYFIAAGVAHFLVGRYTNYKCTKAVGANIGGPIQQFTVVVSVVLAILVLEESINWLGWIGIVLLTVGPLAVAKAKKKDKVEKLEFEFKLAEGYFYGIASSICYGASPVLIALAFQENNTGLATTSTWQLAIFGAFIGHFAATLVLLAIVLIFGLTDEVKRTDPKNIPFFIYSAVFVFLSQGLRYVALVLAPVYIVSPVQRTSTIFRVIFSKIVNPTTELFGIWIWIGIGVSLAGAVLLAIPEELLMEYFSAL